MKGSDSVDVLNETFFDIISKGDLELLKDFMENNPSLLMSYTDENNQNGLFYAASSIESDDKCLSVLHHLICRGMSPILIDKFNQTILFYSCAAGLCNTTQWLLDKFQLDVDHADTNGQTPLFYAVKENRIPIVQLLIKEGANKHHLDKEGLNCLYMIEDNDHVELVIYLLDLGIDPKVVGKNGQQFSRKAERMGFFKIIDALKGKRESKEDVRHKYFLANKTTKKPLTEAELEAFKKENPALYRLLEDYEYLKQQMNENCSSDVDINQS